MSDVSGPVVEVRGLVAGYPGVEVLRELSLDAKPATVTAVVGPNGAGKSTLFRSLLGFFRPQAGRILLDGLPPRRFRRSCAMGFLPEAPMPPAGWTVSEWVVTAARLRGAAPRLARRQAADVLDGLDWWGPTEVRLDRLSRGAARIAGLAFALVGDPAAVLLDEPLASLDTRARAAARNAVRDLAGRGATVLLATHELREVPGLADHALLLDGGRVLARLDAPDPSDMEARILGARAAS